MKMSASWPVLEKKKNYLRGRGWIHVCESTSLFFFKICVNGAINLKINEIGSNNSEGNSVNVTNHYSVRYRKTLCSFFCLDKLNRYCLLLSRFSRVRLCVTPKRAAHQAPPSLGFSRQEHGSGLPFPSPMHESEKWKGSRSVVSDS